MVGLSMRELGRQLQKSGRIGEMAPMPAPSREKKNKMDTPMRAEESSTKRNNRGAQKAVVDGITFDSRYEAARYAALKACEKHGVITDLQLQVKYPLEVNGSHVCTYIADFTYKLLDGTFIVEDAKGYREPVYRLKAKLFQACMGFAITETTNTGSIARNIMAQGHALVALGTPLPDEGLTYP